jgi:ribosomal protein S18 acetylase RimI-like enzyme
MGITFQVATASDVSQLLSLHNATTQKLISQFGRGFWSGGITGKGVLFTMRKSTVYIAKEHGMLLATFALSTRKPWAIDKSRFLNSKHPLYLTSMAVHPDVQRKGVGKLCLDEAAKIAANWPSDAIRLDAYDAAAGAGEFYRKCGFREVGKAVYRGTPLIYFEMLL